MTVDRMLELLKVKEIPEATPEQLKELAGWSDELANQHGEQWITDNRDRLLSELDLIL